MKIKIAENIKTLRKQHSFTQEQLSEALGVTVSAVYKWESGQSVPEVKMLMELADLFEVSVDTLLGYDRQNENVENRIKRINQCMLERDFEEVLLEVEKTLKKYPNRFEVVHVAAAAYGTIYGETKDEKILERAIELFYSAIPLLYQNKETSINETTIMNQIGYTYLVAGQEEKAIELLKENNICGINNPTLGLMLAMRDKGEEAKEFLYYAYFGKITEMMDTMRGLMYLYGRRGNELYKEVGDWLLNYLDSLVVDREVVNFYDKFKAMIVAEMAILAADLGNHEEAEQYIREAYRRAVKFDATPDYKMQVMKFWQDWDMLDAFVTGSTMTAMEAIECEVFAEAKQGAALDFIKEKFEELKRINKN